MFSLLFNCFLFPCAPFIIEFTEMRNTLSSLVPIMRLLISRNKDMRRKYCSFFFIKWYKCKFFSTLLLKGRFFVYKFFETLSTARIVKSKSS